MIRFVFILFSVALSIILISYSEAGAFKNRGTFFVIMAIQLGALFYSFAVIVNEPGTVATLIPPLALALFWNVVNALLTFKLQLGSNLSYKDLPSEGKSIVIVVVVFTLIVFVLLNKLQQIVTQ